MAILFIPKSRRQKYLLFVFGGLSLIGLFFGWFFFLGTPPLSFFSNQPPPPQLIEIDFSVLETPAFQELGTPRPPIPRPEEVGKANPFLPIP